MTHNSRSQITAYLMALFVLGLGLTTPLYPKVARAQEAQSAFAAPSWFLKDCKNPRLRATLFDLYKKSEFEVRRFATYGNWRDIQEVEVMTDAIRQTTGAGALWGVTNGRVIIHIPADANDKGVIFYEMFHGAFDHSPLEALHDKWAADAGAAWCNAFRYLMEARYVPDSPWLAAVNNRMAAGVNLNISAPNPDLILFYCGNDYDRFKIFWKERQSRPNESLDTFFAAHAGTTLEASDGNPANVTAITPSSAATPPNPPPESFGEGSSTNAPAPPADENADRLTLATGRSVSCNVTDCLAGEVTVKLSFMVGDHSTTSERRYKVSEIDSISFAAPNIPLAKKIVTEALMAQNGCLAYDIACNQKLGEDRDMKWLSNNQELQKAVVDFRAERQTYDSLVKTIAEMKRDPASFRFYNPRRGPGGAPLSSVMGEMTMRVNAARIKYDAAKATMTVVCEDVIHPLAEPQTETYFVGVDLGPLVPTYPEGATSIQRGEANNAAGNYARSLAGKVVKARGFVTDVISGLSRRQRNYDYRVRLTVEPVERISASAFGATNRFSVEVYTNDSVATKAKKGDLLSCTGTMELSSFYGLTTIQIMASRVTLEPKQ